MSAGCPSRLAPGRRHQAQCEPAGSEPAPSARAVTLELPQRLQMESGPYAPRSLVPASWVSTASTPSPLRRPCVSSYRLAGTGLVSRARGPGRGHPRRPRSSRAFGSGARLRGEVPRRSVPGPDRWRCGQRRGFGCCCPKRPGHRPSTPTVRCAARCRPAGMRRAAALCRSACRRTGRTRSSRSPWVRCRPRRRGCRRMTLRSRRSPRARLVPARRWRSYVGQPLGKLLPRCRTDARSPSTHGRLVRAVLVRQAGGAGSALGTVRQDARCPRSSRRSAGDHGH